VKERGKKTERERERETEGWGEWGAWRRLERER